MDSVSMKYQSLKKRYRKLKKAYKKYQIIYEDQKVEYEESYPHKYPKNHYTTKDIIIVGGSKDNDSMFSHANDLLKENKVNDALQIYKMLYDNNYNKYNIGVYLLTADRSVNSRNIFRDLSIEYKDDIEKMTLAKINFYKSCLFAPHLYDISIDDLEKYRNDFSNILENKKNLGNVDIFTFSIFSRINNLHNAQFLFDKEKIENMRREYSAKRSTNKIGFYSIDKYKSPVFYHFLEVYYYLSQIDNNLILFLDNSENELNEYDKKMLANIELHCVKDLSDDELCDLIHSKEINKLICQYGHYNRVNIMYKKPCNIIINGIDGGFIIPNFLVDYNLMFNQNFMNLQNICNFLKLDKFLPVYKNNENYEIVLTNPEYNKDLIKIGLIANPMKFSGELMNFIKKILEKNKNIKLTVYSYGSKEYLQKSINIYDENKLFVTTYNNSSNQDLRSNIFYIDTFHYNNHSTLMEILSSYRPFISYTDTEKYFGNVSESIIKSINMKDELNANNPDSYYDLVTKYVNSEEEYTKMFNKFVKNLDESKILDNKIYAQELYSKIKSI